MFITALIFWPLLAAAILLMLDRRRAHVVAVAAALVELALALTIAARFQPDASFQFAVDLPWIASQGIRFHAAIDGISLMMVLLTTGLTPFILLASSARWQGPASFYALILVMETALVGVFTVLDGLLFYVFWEMALIPIYIICLRWGGENRAAITLKFFIYTLAGSLLMLVALIFVYFNTPDPHSFDIQALYQAAHQLPRAQQGVIFWAMFVAFAIKMPLFPFHTWQPDTYNTAPSQGAMLLSGIMLKMGIFGLIRWLIPMVPQGVHDWGLTAIVLAVIGVVYASCIAIAQKDLKRLIAWSSIAHVGLIAAGIFTLNRIGIQGAMVQMISHGIVIVALFFVVDIILARTDTQEMARLGGIRATAPRFATAFIIVILGSIALPLTSGFVGEFMLINSLFTYDRVLGAFAGLTMILGAVYMLRSFQITMLGEGGSASAAFADLTGREKVVLYPLVALILAIGIYPAPLLKISEAAVTEVLDILTQYHTLR